MLQRVLSGADEEVAPRPDLGRELFKDDTPHLLGPRSRQPAGPLTREAAVKVSRTMAYAVQALMQITDSTAGIPISCHQLARDGRMPAKFLLQILRSLVAHGLLRSIRGSEGGYMLAREPDEITLLDVYEAFDTPIVPSIPPLEGLHEAARKILADTMNSLAAAAHRELSRVSLADLVAHSRSSPTN